MQKFIVLLIFISNMIYMTAVTPLDSLFVSAVIRADKECLFLGPDKLGTDMSYLYELVRKNGKAVTSYRHSHSTDTIYIICDYPLEGGSYYYIKTPAWDQRTDFDKFEYINLWTPSERYDSPEIEWIENWETDSLKKYGVYSRSVRDGIANRYVVRYIVRDNYVRTDTVKYVPNIDILYNWEKWRRKKYGFRYHHY